MRPAKVNSLQPRTKKQPRRFARQSVLVGLVVAAMSTFSVINYYMQVKRLRFNYAETQIKRELELKNILVFARDIGGQGQWDGLRAALEGLRHAGFLDFYLLQENDKPVWFGTQDGDLGKLNRHFEILDQPVWSKAATYETLSFGGDKRLTIGFGTDIEAFLDTQMKNVRLYLLMEWTFFSFIVLFAGLWSMRDILLMSFRLRRGDFRGFSNVHSNSIESELFARGMQGFSEEVDQLHESHDRLSRQVLPSLKNEFLSGRTPPYEFDCTLVRVDINNFTQIYNKFNVRELMSTINEFFIEVSHVVSRYDGLVHEFVGDEVIFYFKDARHPNSFLTALSAIRDIIVIAEEFDRKITVPRGYEFKIKASLAHGNLYFGPLVNGFGLAGAVLIETVRVLSAVSGKAINSIHFDQSHAERLSGVCTAEEAMTVVLKGFNGERVLLSYKDHLPLANVVEKVRESQIENLRYYRSDEHLMFVLKWLRNNPLDESQTIAALELVKEAVVTKMNGELVDFVFSWIGELSREKHVRWHLVSSLITFLPSLIPRTEFDSSIESRLLAFGDLEDGRAVGNTIDVLTHFGSRLAITHRKAFKTYTLRIETNDLIRLAEGQLSSKVVRKLKKMLSSEDFRQIASGIYAMGEIASFYMAKDRVYYRTRVSFLDLLWRLPQLIHIEDESVRRQLMLAVQKTGEGELIDELESEVRKLNDEALSLQFERVFPERRRLRAAS
jgi:adenylate cyclase